VADSAEHAYRMLDTQNIDAVLLELKLPGTGGLQALHQIRERRPDAVIVVVTGYGTVQSAVQAMKNGAYDYVTSMEELRLLLDRVSSHLKLKSENRMLREKIKSKQGFGSVIGRAPEMEKLYRIIAKAAHSTHPVLILGESGTGKELWPDRFISQGRTAINHSFRWTVARSCLLLLRVSYSAMSKPRSPAPFSRAMGSPPLRKAALCFWTK